MDLKTLIRLKTASGGGRPAYTEKTATGNPLKFTTDVVKPLNKLLIPFESNGLTGLNIYHTGKNIFDKTVTPVDGYITGDGTIAGWNVTKTVYCRCSPNTKYTVSKIVTARFFIGYTASVPAAGSTVSGVVYDNTATSLSITTGADAKYLAIFCYHANYDSNTFETIVNSLQVEIGNSATAYEAYTGTAASVAFGETANNGELDALTGVLTVTSPASKTINVTPVAMSALVGDNVIWTDTAGSNTAKYLQKA